MERGGGVQSHRMDISTSKKQLAHATLEIWVGGRGRSPGNLLFCCCCCCRHLPGGVRGDAEAGAEAGAEAPLGAGDPIQCSRPAARPTRPQPPLERPSHATHVRAPPLPSSGSQNLKNTSLALLRQRTPQPYECIFRNTTASRPSAPHSFSTGAGSGSGLEPTGSMFSIHPTFRGSEMCFLFWGADAHGS